MNDTIIVLLLPLLLLVMITPVVYATNESSYKQGFTAGVDDYTGCQNRPDDCSPPDNDAPLQVCVNNPVNHEVTNSTACIDGYIQGWQHWCKSDLKDCGQFTMEGRLPGALISGHNLYHTADGNYIRLPGIRPMQPGTPTATMSDLSKGVCPPGMYPDKTLGVYHCHDAHGTHGLAPANITNQWYRAW